MNYRQKCKNNSWIYVKFKGDTAIYASCSNCGNTIASYKNERDTDDKIIPFKIVPATPPKYCSKCGLKLKVASDKVFKIDNLWGV